jgi:hypothetical protein
MGSSVERTGRRATFVSAVAAAAIAAAACSTGAAGPAWSAVTDHSAFAAATVHDVTANGAGFVAVGSVNVNGAPNGAIWSSPDGLTWTAETIDYPNATFLHVGHAGTGFVAIGSQCAGECAGSSFWSSPDGKSWTQQGDYQDMIFLVAVADTAAGVAAVGADWTTGYPENPPDVAAYASTDGAAWTRSPTATGMKYATMGAVAPHGTGLVALGNTGPNITAWSSQDGKAWTTLTASSGLGTGEVRDMLEVSTNLVAVGREGQDAVAWTSTDGSAWTRTPAGSSALQAAVMERLATAGSRIIAVGQDHASGSGAIWTSTDGGSWAKAPTIPGGAVDLGAIAVAGTIAIAFGRAADGSVVILRAATGS